jgi:predicted nucleic acid-binding protein
MNVYADTNFLVRLFLKLPGEGVAAALDTLARGDSPAIPVTWLHRVEVCNAIQLYVFQYRAGGQPRITAEIAGAAWAQFGEDLRQGKLRAASVSAPELADEAEMLSLRHTAPHGFRTYDLIHVASALMLGCDTFWSFDTKASRLAKLEGLRTI